MLSLRRILAAFTAALVAALLAALLVGTPAGARLLVWSVERAAGSTPLPRLAEAQAIALLGGRTMRVHAAARLHQRTGLPLLVTGKGTGDAPFSTESEKMAHILRSEYRIEPRWIETESLDTAENARFSWCLVAPQGIRTIALVTDPRHLLRARAAFRAAGFEVLPAPIQAAPRPPLAWRDLWPTRTAVSVAASALRDWGGAVVAAWEVWSARGDAQKCPSSSARTATKVQTPARNTSQAPGLALR